MDASTKKDLEILRATRRNILNLIEDLSYEQLTIIPKGFSNSILWNFVHLAVTQQLLCFGLSGGDVLLKKELIDKFKKGGPGDSIVSRKELFELKDSFLNLVDQTESYYTELKNNEFNVYTTSYNITLNSLDETIQFVNTHEGLHYGVMMALKKFV